MVIFAAFTGRDSSQQAIVYQKFDGLVVLLYICNQNTIPHD